MNMINNVSKIKPIPEYLIMPDTQNIALTVSCHIIQIGSIDMLNQTFTCRLMFIFNWKTLKKFDEIDVSKNTDEWKPTIQFLNNKKQPVRLYEDLHKIKRKRYYSQMSYKVVYDGLFIENYELKHFPIDIQRLFIRLVFIDFPQSVLKECEYNLPNSFKLLKATNLFYNEGFNHRNEWELVQGIHMNEGKTLPIRTDGYRYKTMNIYITISRKVGFYIWNALIPVTVIVLCSCVSFIINSDDLFGSSTLASTMMLSLIALKFSLLQNIQTTSNMTYFDKYILIAFVYIAIVILQNVIIYSLNNNENYIDKSYVKMCNLYSGVVITGSWFIFSITVFIIMSIKQIRYKISYPIDDESFDIIDLETTSIEIFHTALPDSTDSNTISK